jgi:outer membrane lipoprotein-sorting protein
MRTVLCVILLSASLPLSAAGSKSIAAIVDMSVYQKKGFSATMIATVTAEGMTRTTESRYQVKGSSTRVEYFKDSAPVTVFLSRNENNASMTYVYNMPRKLFYRFNDGPASKDTLAGMDPDYLESIESIEKTGQARFAGIMADRYRVRGDFSPGEAESAGDYYIYVDPKRKVIVGSYFKTAEAEMKWEFSNIAIGVDDSVFVPMKGFTESEEAVTGLDEADLFE